MVILNVWGGAIGFANHNANLGHGIYKGHMLNSPPTYCGAVKGEAVIYRVLGKQKVAACMRN